MPAGNPLSESLERREAGIRASPDHGEGGRVRGEKGAEAPPRPVWCHRGSWPPASLALCFLHQFSRREALTETLGQESRSRAFALSPAALGTVCSSGCLFCGPCSRSQNHRGPGFFLASPVLSP